MKGIQNTTTVNFSSLIGNGKKYIVPKFQRDYSWDEEQWDDLWIDIETMLTNGMDHYMGYLVLQTSNNKDHFIIDGQQRFTTITIIVLAAIKSIKKLMEKACEVDDNKQRLDSLMASYIGNVDPVSLEYDNYLVLNRNNDGYYKEYIVKLAELKKTRISSTEKLMKKCFEWFEANLYNKYSSGKEYAEFIVNMLDNLFFTVITVNDEMNAFRVFETLNARGVQLSASDLLKNYLFSLVDDASYHRGRVDALEEKWARLTVNMGSEKLPEFLRYFWNSRNKIVRANDLFKEVRKEIKDAAQVFELMNDLLSYSDVYIALKDKNDEYWDGDPEICECIGLLNIFNLKQPYSILMAANKRLDNLSFKKVLKSVIIISFRYSVICGRNPNEIEKAYNNAALYISENKKFDMNLLKKVYIDDRDFAMSFTTKTFVTTSRNTKIIRYILSCIDEVNIDITDDNNSIEHILPQSPSELWEIEDDKVEKLSTRIGNLCLLERKLNKQAQNVTFEEKKHFYVQSVFPSTRSVAENYDRWDENAIGSRQADMARKAKSIWKLIF